MPINFFTIYAHNCFRSMLLRLHSTEFGQFYEIRGPLVGPNAVTLQIRAIWMKENLSGVTKFITLIPEK